MVAASDVLYERPNAALVAAAFAKTLGPGGLGLLTDPGRKHAAGFADECRRHGLSVTCQGELPIFRDAKRQTIDLYEIRRI